MLIERTQSPYGPKGVNNNEMPFTACLRLKTWETIQSCHEHSLRRQIKIHQKHGPKEWERQFSSVSNLDKFFNADIKLDQDRESKDRFCEICNSVGHSTEECTALDGRRKAACLTSKYYCRCFDANNIPATSHKLSKSSTCEAKNCSKTPKYYCETCGSGYCSQLCYYNDCTHGKNVIGNHKEKCSKIKEVLEKSQTVSDKVVWARVHGKEHID